MSRSRRRLTSFSAFAKRAARAGLLVVLVMVFGLFRAIGPGGFRKASISQACHFISRAKSGVLRRPWFFKLATPLQRPWVPTMETTNTSSFNFHFRPQGSRPIESIQYAIGCSLQGAILVARSTQGICAIFHGDDDQELHDQLRKAYPRAELTQATQSMRNDLDAIIAYVDHRVCAAPIDLDIGGTRFQQRVWAALCTIPAGQTRSYTELAISLGRPGSVRAVASACAANALAIVIPCHRILRSDGSITGYRW